MAGSRHMRTSRLDNVSPTRVKSVDEVVAGRKDLDTGAPDLVDLLSAGTLVGIAQVERAALVAAAACCGFVCMDGNDCWPLRPRGFSLLVRSRVVVFGLR
eukprot:COSAG01_NODE_23509_length_812_cov_3.918654_1_plen_99_part_01